MEKAREFAAILIGLVMGYLLVSRFHEAWSSKWRGTTESGEPAADLGIMPGAPLDEVRMAFRERLKLAVAQYANANSAEEADEVDRQVCRLADAYVQLRQRHKSKP